MVAALIVENISRISAYHPDPKIGLYPYSQDHLSTPAASVSRSLSNIKGASLNNAASKTKAFDASKLNVNMRAAVYHVEAHKKSLPLKEGGFQDLKQQIGTLSNLKSNLNVNNLGQTLAQVHAMGNSAMEKRMQMDQVANVYQNVRDMFLSAYQFDLSLKAQSAASSRVLDTYM